MNISGFTPENTEFVLLSFEGPDQPYSQAGGLGVRVTNLATALARLGFQTHLFFVGDPDLPGFEEREGGKLRLNRWCQWQSRYHRGGVYDNEEWKVANYQETIPHHVSAFVVRSAVDAGRQVVIIAEEWHTADTLCRLSDSLHFLGLRGDCILMWNANNDMSLHRINWGRLAFAAQLTAVSRYVKHQMRFVNSDAVVIPNGIPDWMLADVPSADTATLRDALGADVLFFKIVRMDPDKGWLQAADAVAALKARGVKARMVMKGGSAEGHRGHFLGHVHWLGLNFAEARPAGRTLEAIAASLHHHRDADIIDIQAFIPDEVLPPLYAAADGVLANSLYEPFGLVGLEAMAAGGIAYVGSTGEDYALSAQNAVVLDTDDGDEIAVMALELQQDPEWAARLRGSARDTARLFTWQEAIGVLLRKLPLMAATQMAWRRG